jgi:peptidoglycan/xylan/chitin deacetylase (PgdA/CDA1 family)
LPDSADSFSAGGIVVSPSTFEGQMAFLRRHFSPISAAEFCSDLALGKFRKRACLVTFDDGWQDVETHAMPVLRRFQIPAAFFVATAFIGSGNAFWQERLTRSLVTLSRRPDRHHPLLMELGLADTCHAPDAVARILIRNYVTRLKSQDHSTVLSLERRVKSALSDYGTCSQEDNGDDVFVGWTSLRTMAQSGLITVGSHAHSHVPLPSLSQAEAANELMTAADRIEASGLPRPWLCAYPNGDCNSVVAAAARASGCVAGFTTEPGHVRVGDDPMQLRRMNIHEAGAASGPEFLCRILGLF